MDLVEQTIANPGGPEIDGPDRAAITRVQLISYGVLIVTLVLAALFGLGTPLVTILFSYFVLSNLRFLRRKWLEVLIFVVLVAAISGGLGYLFDQVVKHLPRVAEKAIPAVIQTAQKHNLELPFSDWASLKDFAIENVKNEFRVVGAFAKRATKLVIFVIIGVVIAASIFLTPFGAAQNRGGGVPNNLYLVYGNEIVDRFRGLYHSFATVMGAQLIISGINTILTAIFILCVGLPYPVLGIGVTFICGILPIIGNLISNSIIVAIGLTVSPQMALWALAYLVGVHKLEYFLNSKIIGRHIKNPVWLTLIGLILGERLMGVPGMILAPVLLDFLRREASRIRAGKPAVAEPEKTTACIPE